MTDVNADLGGIHAGRGGDAKPLFFQDCRPSLGVETTQGILNLRGF